jgi:hypothetical protein
MGLDCLIGAFQRLQCLQLIPAGQIMTWASLIPFSRQSPIQLPKSLSGAFNSFILLLCLYSMDEFIEYPLANAIERLTKKRDRPDEISSEGAEDSHNASVKIPRLRELRWILSDGLKFHSLQMKRWVGRLLGAYFKVHGADEPESSQRPTELPAHPSARLEEVQSDRASTATPDPADLFASDEIVQPTQSQPAPSEQHHPLSRTNTLFTPLNQSPATTPPASPRVRASLIHRDSETVTMQLELLETQREMDEERHGEGPETTETLVNGSEAVAEQPSSGIEAGEAAADVETIITEIAQLIRNEEDPSDQQPDEIHRKEDREPQFRETSLSEFSTEAIATHAGWFYVTVLVIPLETILVRSLASTFLGSSPLANDVRPLFSWRGWRYNTTMLSLLGVQMLVSSAVWGLGTTVAIGLGRAKYRWGRL